MLKAILSSKLDWSENTLYSGGMPAVSGVQAISLSTAHKMEDRDLPARTVEVLVDAGCACVSRASWL